ncbi:MAG: HAMP domain-containing protein [Deltaproteobacteria bacterium]|nr:HAMP domain-containing protein [Deltaproteobacteria bacterium]
MNRAFSFGLIGRIGIALSLVFALLILLNDLTVTSVIKMSLSSANESPTANTDSAVPRSSSPVVTVAHLRKPILIYSITAALVSLFIASFALHRIAVRPIRRLTRALDDVAHGKTNVRVPLEGSTELIVMGANFNRMIDTIQQQKQNLESQLTQLEQTTAELKSTQNDLIRAARLASVGTLASGVAHEIGNPIAGILGLLEALDNEHDVATSQSYRSLIRREIERIDKIIRDLLSYARPARTDGNRNASLAQVLSHVKRLMGMQKSFGHISLQLPDDRTMSDLAPTLAMPEDDLIAIFVNLFLNAAQALDGEGTIRVYFEYNLDSAALNTIDIHVVDSGPGIDSEIADRIFDPFFSNRKAGGGTGLGLAICMSICERNNAHIELVRHANTGAHFRVVVPLLGSLPSPDVNML